MLQSLVPQSPISNMNPKRVDRDDNSSDETITATKRRNISDEGSISGEKALVEELHRDKSELSGLGLLGLLLQCVECVSMENLDNAIDLLPEIAEGSSPYSSSPQKVGTFFTHTLSSARDHFVLGYLLATEFKNPNLGSVSKNLLGLAILQFNQPVNQVLSLIRKSFISF